MPTATESNKVMVERSARAGQMAPLHRRDVREAYRVLEGEVTFYVGSDVVEASAGQMVVAPEGAERTFRVESDRARWVVLTRVRSLARFADFGRAVASAAPGSCGEWTSREDEMTVAAIGKPNGIELLGSPGAVPGSC
jgi:hypothetical protein